MKISDYQAARQISYDRAYRAIKHAVEKRGGKMGIRKVATIVLPEDIPVADAFLAHVGTRRAPVGRIDREAQFRALRKEWVEKWSAAYKKASYPREDLLTVLGYIGESVNQEAMTVGTLYKDRNAILTLAQSLGVDRLEEGSFSGFTKFLMDLGY